MAEEEGVTKKKSENFSEWYHEVIQKADIIDQRYPLQGFLVYKGNGLAILEKAIGFLEDLLNANGYTKCYFPPLIPESLLKKEEAHIRGFQDEVFWVTRAGQNEMGEKVALRPTSETAMYEMLKLWIRSHRDLPTKIYQSTSVWRYETKHTRPLIRDRELLWNEAHSLHATLKDVSKHMKEMIRIYSKVYEFCAIPVVFIDVKTGLFAGAVQAIEAYTIFPDGKVLEMGSINNLGQRFSKAFDIKFVKEDGTQQYVYQGCYGISERLVAAVVAIHGDDKGLVLPPNVASVQAVIVPIFGEDDENIIKYCKAVYRKLRKKFRIKLDLSREKTPGWKFNHYEMLGIPVRIEIGKKEVESKTVTLVRRNDREEFLSHFEKLPRELDNILKSIQTDMYKKALSEFQKRLSEAKNMDDLRKILNEKGGLVKTEWCGKQDCADNLKAESKGGEIIGVPYGVKEKANSSCVWCNDKSRYIVYVGNTY
ncbi:MAG: proline--tRNA ligase [Candidatus Aenigmatarchaeota archaeon]|nr:proline--tRNA ligase [Candidatus Aenigmarchaeota archaeon]